jgi:hypothetical protein
MVGRVSVKSHETAYCMFHKSDNTDRTINMGEVVAADFRVERKLTGLLPEENSEASHKLERQRRVRQLLTFAIGGEPAIVSRPES